MNPAATVVLVFIFVVLVGCLGYLIFWIGRSITENDQQGRGRIEFLENLIAKGGEPKITTRWAIAYLWEARVKFEDVELEVEFNTVRSEWDLMIWTRIKGKPKHIFYYDCISPKPVKAIRLVVKTYKLDDLMNKDWDIKRQEDHERKLQAQKLIERYTS